MIENKYNKEDNPQNINEPTVPYVKNVKFRHYTSFEDMNEGDAIEISSYTPEEHLMHVTELIQSIYTEELSKPFSFRKSNL